MPTARPDARLFDVRLADRFFETGVVSKAEQKKFLDSLPDLADQMETVDVSPDPSDSASSADAGSLVDEAGNNV